MLEKIRLTIISNLLQYHPVCSSASLIVYTRNHEPFISIGQVPIRNQNAFSCSYKSNFAI
jgi:hypothetical protein